MAYKTLVWLDKSLVFLNFKLEKNDDWVWMKAGQYEMERIKNPKGGDTDWLVFKGTSIGGTVDYFQNNTILLEVEEE